MLEKGEQGLKKRIKYAVHSGVEGKPLANPHTRTGFEEQSRTSTGR